MTVGVEVGDDLDEGFFVGSRFVLEETSDAEPGVAVLEKNEPCVPSHGAGTDESLVVDRDRCAWVWCVNAISKFRGKFVALAQLARGAVD